MSNQNKAKGYEGLILRIIVVIVVFAAGAVSCNWIINAFANFGSAPIGVEDGSLTRCMRMAGCVSSKERDDDAAYVAPIGFSIPADEALSILERIIPRLPNADIRVQDDYYFWVRIGSPLGNASDLEVYVNLELREIQLKLEPRYSATEIEWTHSQVEQLQMMYEQELE